MRLVADPAIVLACLGATLAAAQGPDPQFHVNVNLVQVDAVVTDAKGHHLSDLRPEDFQITEDGKPQKIASFSWIVLAPEGAPARASGNLAKEELQRSMVIIVDDADPGMGRDLMAPFLGAAKEFVDQQITRHDMVSVMSTRGGMGFYQQFTNDKRQIDAALDHLPRTWGTNVPGRSSCGILNNPGASAEYGMLPPSQFVKPNSWAILTGLQAAGAPPVFEAPKMGSRAAPSLLWAIQGLRGLPGRKAVVVLACSGFQPPPEMAAMANQAGVVIYAIDPQGATGYVLPTNRPDQLLIQGTGGKWIRSAGGAPELTDLQGILEDMSGYYLLGYYRNGDTGPPVHHEVKVVMKRRGLTARARSGFLGQPDPAPAAVSLTREQTLQRALFSPFASGGIRLRLQPSYAATLPDPSTGRRLPAVRTTLEIDGRDVRFADADDGKKRLVLDVLVSVFNQDGAPAGDHDQTFTLDATPEQASRMTATGLHYKMDVNVAGPGAYQLRAAVRDSASGAIGNAYTFLELPDFNKPPMSLSSLGLWAASYPGWNEFPAGSTIEFGCEVFGLKTAAEAKVEMGVALFGPDGAPVYTRAVAPALLDEVHGQTVLSGRLALARGLDPGNYTLQLNAYDRRAQPGKQAVSQSVDLTIVKPER